MAETKARHIANLVEDDGDVKSAHLDNITVTPTAVSDQANTSTGYFDVPSGTEAQRPGSPNAGNLRFNTDLGSLEVHSGTSWVSTNEPTPTIASISGTIYAGISGRSLTITGTDFNINNVSIEWLDGTTRIVKEDSITPTSATSITRTIPASVYGKASGTTIGIRVLNAGSVASNIDTSKSVIGLPSGGTESGLTGGYYYHTFTTSGNFIVPSGFSVTVDYLLVAGGGGGGYDYGGGGGAGGAIDSTASVSSSSSPYQIVIGDGGSAGLQNTKRGANGVDSSAFGQTAIGGGGGQGGASAPGALAATSGGSGGGGGWNLQTPGSGTSGQGNNGGTGNARASNPVAVGGGGGKNAQGGNGTNTASGNGGAGINWKSLGTSYAGGGGGGGYAGYGVTAGSGGTGGGGDAGLANLAAQDGSANTGGGGGGDGGGPGLGAGAGGKGVVIIRYQIP